MKKNKSVRLGIIGGLAAIALTVTVATPAFAGSAVGSRSCSAPKTVSLQSLTQGGSGYHQYLATSQTFFFTNPNPGSPYLKTTYSAATSSNWVISTSGPLNYYAASCI